MNVDLYEVDVAMDEFIVFGTFFIIAVVVVSLAIWGIKEYTPVLWKKWKGRNNGSC